MRIYSQITLEMKKIAASIFFAFVFSAFVYGQGGRSVENIDRDWYFHKGDVTGGESNNVDYSTWRKLDVPHDWTIEEEYSQKNGRENAFLPGGIAWYKKEIEWRDEWAGKEVEIEFDAIFTNSTVWLNGNLLGNRPQGYQGINWRLTQYLKPGKNILTVKVDNSLMPSSRWYQGAGIYRHVWLIEHGKTYVDRYGVWARTLAVDGGQARVVVETTVATRLMERSSVEVRTELRGAGQCVSSQKNLDIVWEKSSVADTLTVISPELWSTENPNMYEIVTQVVKDGKVLDEVATPFGIRTMEFSSVSGFSLNGVGMKMKGVCLHQNMGAVGSAMTEDIWERRLEKLKDMGCNAIRTSHYAYSPEFYDLCDRMGFLVVDEPWDGWFYWYGCHKAKYDYTIYFLKWWKTDLEEFIKRDRNHPCVAVWSCGNEVWGWDKRQYLQWEIVDMYHRLDPTRPTVQAYAQGQYIDLAGFNADGENIGDLENFHNNKPGMVALGTEIPHNRQTRGVYRTIGSYNSWDKADKFSDKEREKLFPVESYTEEEVFTDFDPHYASGYDNQPRRITHRKQWQRTRDFDFMVGQFLWTGYDYLGESWGWPGRTNNFGIIDLAGFPKDAYYLYQSLWTEKPMVHILPHWTWPGKDGVEIPVVAYSNCDEVELFLNGKSLGRKVMDKKEEMQIVWKVPYRPGTVRAVAYRDGRKCAETVRKTAGAAYSVRLTVDRKEISLGGREHVFVTADIVDRKGTLVPMAGNMINFQVDGPYKLVGVENGDIIDMSPHKVLYRNAFMGKALLILQADKGTGIIKVSAESDGLKKGSAEILVK